MKIAVVFGLLAAAVLSGCVTQERDTGPTKRELREAQFRRTIPQCDDAVDCKVKWQAAQLWVSRNAGYKIQIATDVLIETYSPPGDSRSLAVRVSKVPIGGTQYQILVETWCASLFGCQPGSMKAALDFNNTVNAIN